MQLCDYIIKLILKQMIKIKKKIHHLVNSKEIFDDGKEIEIFNPATGQVLSTANTATDKTIKMAIENSQDAFLSWKNTSISKRISIFFKYKELLEKNINQIAYLISQDLGKTKSDAIGEIRRGIENVEFACSFGSNIKGEHNKNISTSIDSWSQFEPLGVVLGITPFNFPVMVPLWMFPLAIVAGNTFILKPSEKDPISTMYIADLFYKAGLPKGVLNVLNGDKSVVKKLLNNNKIKAVSFVGSTPVAQYVYETSTQQNKRCQALGGAKNHALVLPDADIKQTVNQLLGAAFGSSGQRCMALSVVVAVGGIGKRLEEELKNAMLNFRVGPFEKANSDFGPLISKDHMDKVEKLINSAEKDGSKIVVDGRNLRINEKKYHKGYFFGATLINNVKTSMQSYKEEIFGPVLQIINVNSFEEGIRLINKNQYGNGCCIFTNNGQSARTFSDNVDIGMVGINIPLPVPAAYHSFGGWKKSFFGDLNIYGPDGLRFYTQRKTITQKWTSDDKNDIKFSMPNNLN
tara:strand:+ start:16159 stop:17712 length:1554 start_codon:yes stop_codon:yes gene_type:complete